jgi:two-component system phosphate regulon sensor histidine kinase PhoR
MQDLERLAALIRSEQEPLLAQWRQQVRRLPSAQDLPTPVLNDHIPALLEELVEELHVASRKSIADALLEGSPPVHGRQRQQAGFDIVEVVAEYNILRGCIHELAESHGIRLAGAPFRILNRVLDEAIGLSVQTFATQQALEVQRRREEYLAFVAHDLRTPLNAVSLATSFLEVTQGRNAEAETAQMLKALRRNVRKLESLVTTVLKENDHVRTESGVQLERRELDLWPLVETMIHDLHPVAGTASTRLLNRIPEDLTAWADATLLTRVFQNLIANAINYTPRGEVEIGAREAGPGGAVECWVRDNGAGIPPDRLESVFDKLETDPDKEGGLGLTIVKTFVEAHGGEVTVASTEGEGSVFRFTLPGRASNRADGG